MKTIRLENWCPDPFPLSASHSLLCLSHVYLIQNPWVPGCSTGHQRNDKLVSPELCGIARLCQTHQPTAAVAPSQLSGSSGNGAQVPLIGAGPCAAEGEPSSTYMPCQKRWPHNDLRNVWFSGPTKPYSWPDISRSQAFTTGFNKGSVPEPCLAMGPISWYPAPHSWGGGKTLRDGAWP